MHEIGKTAGERCRVPRADIAVLTKQDVCYTLFLESGGSRHCPSSKLSSALTAFSASISLYTNKVVQRHHKIASPRLSAYDPTHRRKNQQFCCPQTEAIATNLFGMQIPAVASSMTWCHAVPSRFHHATGWRQPSPACLVALVSALYHGNLHVYIVYLRTIRLG